MSELSKTSIEHADSQVIHIVSAPSLPRRGLKEQKQYGSPTPSLRVSSGTLRKPEVPGSVAALNSPSRFGSRRNTPRIRFSLCTKADDDKDRVTAVLTAPTNTSPRCTPTALDTTNISSPTPLTPTSTPTPTPTTTSTPIKPHDNASITTDILRPRWQNRSAGRRRGGRPGLLTSMLSKDSSILSDFRFATSEYTGTSNESVISVNKAGEPVDENKDDTIILEAAKAELSVHVVRFLGWSLSKVWRKLFSRVEVDQTSIDMLTRLMNKKEKSVTPVVLLPSHRSHVDYLMLSYIMYGNNLPVPCIVAGDNLKCGMIGSVLKSAGAFFIRRTWKNSSDKISNETKGSDYSIYRRTIRRYVDRLMTPVAFGGSGLPMEFFIEGGRSRDGIPLSPKVGMLTLIMNNYVKNISSIPDVHLVPISLTYERVPEGMDMSEQRLGKLKTPESFWNIFWTGFKLMFLDWETKGRMHIRCGAPLSLKRLMEQSIEKERLKLSQANGGSGSHHDEKENDAVAVIKGEGQVSFSTKSTTDIVQVLEGMETAEKSITTAIDVASSVQRAVRLSTVVPLTSIVASSILHRIKRVGSNDDKIFKYTFTETSLDEIVADVVEMAELLHTVGGILGGWAGPPPPSSSRLKRNVVRGLRLLDMVVDMESNMVKDMKENDKKRQLMSPLKRLEISAIRNQWLHLLSVLPFDSFIDAKNDRCEKIRQCVRNVVTHRYRLYEVHHDHHDIQLSERQTQLLHSAIQSAVEVYVHVGEYLSTQTTSNHTNKEIARDIQQFLKPFAYSIEADALAMDTLSGAVDWYSKNGPDSLDLLIVAKKELGSDQVLKKNTRGGGDAANDTPLWMM
jgi:1-acyl-sn-glycerol-3-phosphate acyltransferase